MKSVLIRGYVLLAGVATQCLLGFLTGDQTKSFSYVSSISVLFSGNGVGGNLVTLARCQEQVCLQAVLLSVEIEVASLKRVQLVVRAALYDTALLDHENLIGSSDR